MPYKHGVTGSSPVVPTKFGPVVQSVSTPACHAGGRRFESVPGRHFNTHLWCVGEEAFSSYASVAQSVVQWTENPRVVGSIPTGGTICGCSSSGRAPPCQGGGSEFEPRHPLHTGPWPSGKARVCKTLIRQFNSGRYLQKKGPDALHRVLFSMKFACGK